MWTARFGFGRGEHFSVILQQFELFFRGTRELMRPPLELRPERAPEFRGFLEHHGVEPLQVFPNVAQQPLVHRQQTFTCTPIPKPPRHRVLRGRSHQLLLETRQKGAVFRLVLIHVRFTLKVRFFPPTASSGVLAYLCSTLPHRLRACFTEIGTPPFKFARGRTKAVQTRCVSR